jgi:hypothetical protein
MLAAETESYHLWFEVLRNQSRPAGLQRIWWKANEGIYESCIEISLIMMSLGSTMTGDSEARASCLIDIT